MNVLQRLKTFASAYVVDKRRREPVYVGIHFDLSKVNINDLHKIEKLLYKNGINFDMGSGDNVRDWEWDWSLKGPITVTFRQFENNDLNEIDNEVNASMDTGSRVKHLRQECNKEDESRFEFVAYLTTKGNKYEVLVLKDNKFKDYGANEFINGRGTGFAPITATSISEVNKWIDKYIKLNAYYDKINYQVHKGN